MKRGIFNLTTALFLAACGSSTPSIEAPPTNLQDGISDAREVHLKNVRQLTRDAGENAEAYWAFDSSELIMQSKRPPFACDQIFRLPVDGSKPQLVSTGLGRTTCAYFLPGDEEIVYSSTHQSGDECPPVPDHSQGYVWPIYNEYNIFAANADGSNLRKLTNTEFYDAEATVCKDGSIVFTSTRNGDLDLYRMDRDGSNVVQLTDTPGYDGGAFFSSDCSQIVWRASRPTGEALSEYKELLADGLVRPSKLELFVADSDGTNVRQITYLNSASFAPFFHPNGKRVLFSSNFADKKGREFDIFAVNTDGTNLERITYTDGFDGFPMFSPDGTKLAFSSNRNQANPGETDVYVADWVDSEQGDIAAESMADTFAKDVQWLADDAREGRGIGTAGIDRAADWLGERFAQLHLSPGVGESFFQTLDVATDISLNPSSTLAIGKRKAKPEEFVAMGFSTSGKVSAPTVFVKYGIVDKALGINDYKGLNLKGKVAVIRRYTPTTEAFNDRNAFDMHSSIHRKAFVARERGAIAVLVVNGQAPGTDSEAPLPDLMLEKLSNVGIPVVVAKESFALALTKRDSRLTMHIQLDVQSKPSRNVVGRLTAGAADKLPGTVFIGAHYDHLGYGGQTSLGDGNKAIHNGADDNASGVAGLLEVARQLVARKSELRRDVVFLAFTGEERGLLGSKYYVKHMPKDTAPFAMFNMDMIGRLRSNRVTVSGATTAVEWPELVNAACERQRIGCRVGGDGYGPSDHSSFTSANIPILYLSTGPHSDYHKPSDDAHTLNMVGGKVVANLVADIAVTTVNLPGTLSFRKVAAPVRPGDRRSFGASLGTIPDYSGDSSKPGMLLSGVRPGGAAAKAGMRAGDRILAIAGTKIHSVRDLVYVLQDAKPGQNAVVKIERGGKIRVLKVTFQKSSR